MRSGWDEAAEISGDVQATGDTAAEISGEVRPGGGGAAAISGGGWYPGGRGGGHLRPRSAVCGEAAEMSGGGWYPGDEVAEISFGLAATWGEAEEIVGASGNGGRTGREMFWASGGSKNLTRKSRVRFSPGFSGGSP